MITITYTSIVLALYFTSLLGEPAPGTVAYSPPICTRKWDGYKKGVFKTIRLPPSPPTSRHLFRCDCRPARPRQRVGHGTDRMQSFGILDSGSPLGKGVTSLPLLRRAWVLPHLPAWQPAPGLPMEGGHPAGRSPCRSPLKNCGRRVHGVPRVQDARNAAWGRVRGVHG
jgi:hypothetical protein